MPDNPAVTPRRFVRKLALYGVNGMFRLLGIKLPPDVNLKQRLSLLRNGLFLLRWKVEPDIQNICDRLLHKGMTVIDVGANVGILTRQFCRQVGHGGKVFAFEPDPFIFQHLKFNTRSFANLQLTQCAISDNHEPALLHLNSISGTGNSLLNKADSEKSVSVPCVSLDEFLDKAGNPVVSLIKIDVEGAELNVLRGMRQTISRLPGLLIIIEYCPKNLQGSGVAPRAVYDELKAGGLTIQFIREDGSTRDINRFEDLEPVLNPHGYTNLLCSRSKS
jgi:FkbM family methyltransferase